MHTHQFGLKFLLAAVTADAAYTLCNFVELIAENIPIWRGAPLRIVASDVVMMPVMFLLQFPFITILALPLTLVAYAYQVHSGMRSVFVFVGVGAVIGLASAIMAFWTIIQWISVEPDWPDAMSFCTRKGPFAVLGGALGGYVYWRRATAELRRSR